MDRVLALMARLPWLVLLLAIGLTAAAANAVYDFGEGRFQLELDPSIDRLLPEGDRGKQFYDRARLVFGNDELMTVAIHSDDVFRPANLRTVRRLRERLERIDGVRSVVSIDNVKTIRSSAGNIEPGRLFEKIPTDQAGIATLREEALSHPILIGNLISPDGRTALLHVEFQDMDDREFARRGLDAEVVRIAREEAGTSEVWVTGGPYVRAAQIKTQIDELRRFIPVVLVVLGVVLAASFRSVRGVVLPLVTIGVALVWSMGVAAWIGKPLNPMSILVPPLLLILGLSYVVHVVSECDDLWREKRDAHPSTVVAEALGNVWLPVTLTGLTTAAGFFALAMSPMRAVSEFGVLSLIGVAAAVLASLALTPALVVVLGRPWRLRRPPGEGGFTRFAQRIAEFDLRRRGFVIGAWIAALVVALGLATQMRVASDSIKSFAPNVPVRRDFEAINNDLGGANRFDIIVNGGETNAFLEPARLREIEQLQRWLEDQPEIGGVVSAVDFIKLLNRGFAPSGQGELEIPESRTVLGQMLFIGGGDELKTYLDIRYQLLRMAVRTSVVDSAELGELVERIEERTAGLSEPMTARVTGNAIVIQGLVNDLVWNQVSSLVIALGVIWAILSAMFLSVRTGLIALIPNAVPIALFFGGLGLSGIPLNTATSLIAPMALGIAIDDTIHYFSRFQADAKRLANERLATVRALRSVGRPMTFTTLAIVGGFLVFTTSDLVIWVQLGLMGAFTLGVAWLVDFTLTPALCSGLRVATMWDTLSLDLGRRPQESIPLFNGLTSLECRLAALIANIREVPSGQQLMRAGEAGREMYLVIDGALEVSVRTPNGTRQVLNVCRRGDVVGEVGFFYKTRSADVDVTEPSRLLRLTQKNMEKLTQRYPRIAAKVLRNLSHIMAERLSNTTDKLAKL